MKSLNLWSVRSDESVKRHTSDDRVLGSRLMTLDPIDDPRALMF